MSTGNGSRSSPDPLLCLNRQCGRPIRRGAWLREGTPFCEYCADKRVAMAFASAEGRAWLSTWYERIGNAIRSAD